MHFYVYIAVGVHLPFLATLAMIVMIIHRFQMPGSFTLLSQTIINADEDLESKVDLTGPSSSNACEPDRFLLLPMGFRAKKRLRFSDLAALG